LLVLMLLQLLVAGLTRGVHVGWWRRTHESRRIGVTSKIVYRRAG
jgi:hypothetical protein